jgi:hypothetical protein
VIDARNRVETAKTNRKVACSPVRTKDVDECNKSRAEVVKAEAALASENTNHANDVKATEQRHRDDVGKAKAALEALPPTSNDKNVILGGIAALVPWDVPEAGPIGSLRWHGSSSSPSVPPCFSRQQWR